MNPQTAFFQGKLKITGKPASTAGQGQAVDETSELLNQADVNDLTATLVLD